SMITGISRVSLRVRSCRQSSIPETFGSIQSIRTRSGFCSSTAIIASSPSAEIATVKPSLVRLYARSWLIGSSSSTTRTFADICFSRPSSADEVHAGGLALGAIVTEVFALDDIVDHLGDMRGVVADPLEVLGD